jgi:hypothetical protein
MTVEIIELRDSQRVLISEMIPHFNSLYEILNKCEQTSDANYTSYKLKDALVWMNATITSSLKDPEPVSPEVAKPVEGEVISAA